MNADSSKRLSTDYADCPERTKNSGGKPQMNADGHGLSLDSNPIPGSPGGRHLTTVFMTLVASGQAAERNVFAETTILYACSTYAGSPLAARQSTIINLESKMPLNAPSKARQKARFRVRRKASQNAYSKAHFIASSIAQLKARHIASRIAHLKAQRIASFIARCKARSKARVKARRKAPAKVSHTAC